MGIPIVKESIWKLQCLSFLLADLLFTLFTCSSWWISFFSSLLLAHRPLIVAVGARIALWLARFAWWCLAPLVATVSCVASLSWSSACLFCMRIPDAHGELLSLIMPFSSRKSSCLLTSAFRCSGTRLVCTAIGCAPGSKSRLGILSQKSLLESMLSFDELCVRQFCNFMVSLIQFIYLFSYSFYIFFYYKYNKPFRQGMQSYFKSQTSKK